MFPFEPVDSQTGRIGDWGFPYHGLLVLLHQDPTAVENFVIPEDRSHLLTNRGPKLTDPKFRALGASGDGSDRRFPNTAHARKIVVPGHTYTREAELETLDDIKGFDYQPFVVVNDRFIGSFQHSYSPDGWIYVAPDDSRWRVDFDLQVFRPNWGIATIKLQRMGLIKYPNSTWGIFSEPDDDLDVVFTYRAEGPIGIEDYDSIAGSGFSVTTNVLDIRNDGNEALWGAFGSQQGNFIPKLYPNFNVNNLASVQNQRKAVVQIDSETTMAAPHIIWKVELFGIPEDTLDPFTMAVSVQRTQTQCGGTIASEQDTIDGQFTYWSGSYFVTCATTGPSFTRPLLGSPCSSPDFPTEPVEMGSVAIAGAASLEDDARDCGWERFLCDGTSVLGDPANTFNSFKWWRFDNLAAPPSGDPWEASREYIVGDRVQASGLPFRCTAAHTTDPDREPGVGAVWNDSWEVQFLPTNFDIQDVDVYGQGISYQRFSAVRHGAADYYIAKGNFVSYDGDPEKENFDEPGVGSSWENFWDGPFNVALNDIWATDKLVIPDWILENQYTDPALQTNATLADATWKCIRAHVTSAETEPGVGAKWPLFWEKAIDNLVSEVWTPPVVYTNPDRVHLDIDPGPTVDDRTYVAIGSFVSTDDNKPPNATFWTEDPDVPDCFNPNIAGIASSLDASAYHVNRHRPQDQDVDIHLKNIAAGAMYRDDDSIKLIEVDVRYQRTLRDKNFDHCWDTGCDPDDPGAEDPCNLLEAGGTFTGSTSRGPSSSEETFTYDFRVDGTIRHTITLTASATAQGADDWTEDFDNYPLTWNALGTRTLIVSWDGIEHGNFGESISEDDTAFGGATGEDILANDKSNWDQNDFVSGRTFTWIDTPYLDAIYQKLLARLDENFPGAGLVHWVQDTVELGPISATDQYGIPRPDRTQEQIDMGDPVPSIVTAWYSAKLVGPFAYGRKSNSGIVEDSQYDNVLEPDDMRWVQYGVFGPDAESPSILTLTKPSPTLARSVWLTTADYGDDIACAYDPINKVIHRNDQYRVVYI